MFNQLFWFYFRNVPNIWIFSIISAANLMKAFYAKTLLSVLGGRPWFGEGNGNPLQCSYLENPRDRGAWWASVYGVAQSQTRLTRLSSSSSNTMCKADTGILERWEYLPNLPIVADLDCWISLLISLPASKISSRPLSFSILQLQYFSVETLCQCSFCSIY